MPKTLLSSFEPLQHLHGDAEHLRYIEYVVGNGMSVDVLYICCRHFENCKHGRGRKEALIVRTNQICFGVNAMPIVTPEHFSRPVSTRSQAVKLIAPTKEITKKKVYRPKKTLGPRAAAIRDELDTLHQKFLRRQRPDRARPDPDRATILGDFRDLAAAQDAARAVLEHGTSPERVCTSLLSHFQERLRIACSLSFDGFLSCDREDLYRRTGFHALVDIYKYIVLPLLE
jgi:hypothetical protein